jgi:hypothetical protein
MRQHVPECKEISLRGEVQEFSDVHLTVDGCLEQHSKDPFHAPTPAIVAM